MAARDRNATWPRLPIGGLVAFASFFLYLMSASPAIGWLDSPEFVAQAVSLGVAHSPGHPLPALLGHAAGLIPVGDWVWRVNLASAMCAALAVGCLYRAALLLLPLAAPRLGEGSRRGLAAITALVFALSLALWTSAVRAEVYALQALLLAAAMWALCAYAIDPKPRSLLSAALCLGLALANHHLMALFVFLPACVLVLSGSRRPRARLALWTAGIGALGLCALAYLPLRSLAHPEVNFGAPHTLERFLWTLRGAAFSKSAAEAHVSTPMVDLVQVLMAIADDLSLPLFVAGAVGVALGLREQKSRALCLWLSAVIGLSIAARVLLGFDPETPDHHAYLLPAVMALCLTSSLALAMLCQAALVARRPLPHAPALMVVALLGILPIQYAVHRDSADMSEARASDEVAHWELDRLPPRSLLLSAYFQTRFRTWALHSVLGARPDVDIIDRSFLSYPGTAAEEKRAHPELAHLIDAGLAPGLPTPMPILFELAQTRPVYAQLHLNLDEALQRALVPAGPFARLLDPRQPIDPQLRSAEAVDAHERHVLAAITADAARAESFEARGALLWHDAMRIDQYCRLGLQEPAKRAFDEARALAPNDQELGELGRRCGLVGHRQAETE